jgi:hypothetical protein
MTSTPSNQPSPKLDAPEAVNDSESEPPEQVPIAVAEAPKPPSSGAPKPPSSEAPQALAENQSEQPRESQSADSSLEESAEFEAPLSAQAAVQLLEREMAENQRAPLSSRQQSTGSAWLQFSGHLLIAAALVFGALKLETSQSASSYVPTFPASFKSAGHPPAPIADKESAGQLTPFGSGKVLYADGHGRFLILALDSKNGELLVEKALDLVYDPRRWHGSKKRQTHHYYFDDIVLARNVLLTALRRDFKAIIASGENNAAVLARVDNLARRLAMFHDAAFLLPYLGHERFFVRRAVALALGEQGYRIAVRELIYSMNTGDSAFREHINELLSQLTGVTFIKDPAKQDQKKAMKAARVWLKKNPQASPYSLGHALQGKVEGRIHRGL